MGPNFFIIGAQRSGTTSLSQYLSDHPKVLFSKPKEPHYFADDFPGIRIVNSLEKYLLLFQKRAGDEIALGEGSTGYLYSSTAIKNIYAFKPNAKIIVLLRNPIDLIYSVHSHLFYHGHESEPNFEKAWLLQERRKNGKNLPNDPRFHAFLQYKRLGKIGFQIQRLLNIVPPKQIKIFLFEEFISQTNQIYEETLNFLGVPFDGKIEFPVINQNRIHIFSSIFRIYRESVPWSLRCIVRKFIQKHNLRKLRIQRLFSRSTKRFPLDQNFRYELIEYFEEDIKNLSWLINRDLNHWLK